MPLNTDNLNRTIFISDNLPFLRALDTESIDLVVIDPPFGKRQTFTGNLRPPLTSDENRVERELMESWGVHNPKTAYDLGLEYPDQEGTTAKFQDIWKFQERIYEDWMDALKNACPAAWWLIQSTRYTHSDNIAAYIAFMVERMIEVKRVLKPTGSVYLHCDHEANAYLRQMMDAVFGQSCFRNEVAWKRTGSHGGAKGWGPIHDTLLFYSKSAKYTWNRTYQEYDAEYIEKYYRHKDERGEFRLVTLTGAGTRRGDSGDSWRGVNPTSSGRHWAVPRTALQNAYPNRTDLDGLTTQEKLDLLDDASLIYWPPRGKVPQQKRYLDEGRGVPIQDVITDIRAIGSHAKERTGYPTQKPQALARRIIEASSNPGDLVLDCFAGCAYVPVAAEQTGRRWIACDMSPRAWTVIRRQFSKQPDLRIVTEGEYAEGEGVLSVLGDDRIIRVRGPEQLPERTTPDVQQSAMVNELPEIKFKQRPVEDDKQIWDAFVDEWGTECWYCGTEKAHDRRELQLDHVEPNRKDGTNDDCWNRALACVACNGDKSDKLTVEETIDRALDAGRISTSARRAAQLSTFKELHIWAKARWTAIKSQRISI